jgi:nucleotide-binding universal stress UspA family protein
MALRTPSPRFALSARKDDGQAEGSAVLEKIVVGYAGEKAGRDAMTLAGELAALLDGEVTVVFPYHPVLAREASEEVESGVRAQAQALLPSGRLTLRWSPSSWPIHALHELAAYEQADLIVFGAARESLGDRLHVSLMERMVHGAPCAVAVAPAGYSDSTAGTFARIGVGFSSSPEGRLAISLAQALAERAGAKLNVIAGAGLEPALASYAFSSPALDDVEREIYEDTVRELAQVCEELGAGESAGVELQTIRGDPGSVLVQRSSELDLLVLGSRAYGPLRHALLGSVSARAMREAHCPVLVVPRVVAGGDGQPDERSEGAVQRA